MKLTRIIANTIEEYRDVIGFLPRKVILHPARELSVCEQRELSEKYGVRFKRDRKCPVDSIYVRY
jgi:hypothetical protein